MAYESMLASTGALPRRDYAEDDIYVLYTGGTTGMPKGVMVRHGDFAWALAAVAAGRRGEPGEPLSGEALVAEVRRHHGAGELAVSAIAPPLMHGTGMWGGVFVPQSLCALAVTLPVEHSIRTRSGVRWSAGAAPWWPSSATPSPGRCWRPWSAPRPRDELTMSAH